MHHGFEALDGPRELCARGPGEGLRLLGRRLAKLAGLRVDEGAKTGPREAVVGGARRVVAGQLKRSANAADRQRIVQRDRLEDRPQLVIPVDARAQHAQRQINFRERPDAHA